MVTQEWVVQIVVAMIGLFGCLVAVVLTVLFARIERRKKQIAELEKAVALLKQRLDRIDPPA